ncbi:LCP family protein required for cell wall assembly [Paenibacillus sp. DS2015]|uniref:LCP family glycopolymer transferase n=1 Tax=Paenibacillus sp. DS2015 TaxID=3373917 RepID=UPI003D240765
MKLGLKISIWVLSIVVIVISGYVLYIYQSVKTTANDIYEPREPVQTIVVNQDPQGGDPKRRQEVSLKDKDSFTVLVLGVDQRENDRGRSDTMIVLTVNPIKQSILMFNIPRDTRTEIVGHGTVDKINHAYAFGGTSMSIQTVEKFLDYPIDYYIKMNMEGFIQIIDLLGGVKVNNPYAFNMEGHSFQQGNLQLDGAEALLFSRMRYDDPKGDLGRNSRQREIIQKMLKSGMQISSIIHIQSMIKEVGDNVKTDINFDNMKKLVTDYRSDLKTIDMVEVRGQGQKMNGIYYYIVDAAERSRIHEVMIEHLNQSDVQK